MLLSNVDYRNNPLLLEYVFGGLEDWLLALLSYVTDKATIMPKR